VNRTTTRDLAGLPDPAPTGKVPRGRFHLLAIGIRSYAHWLELKTAVNGARSLANTLSERYGFDEVKLLLDEEATMEAILRELHHLAKNLKQDDSAVISFDGHGHLDQLTGACWWIPHAGLLPNEDTLYEAEGTWLLQSRVKDLIRACQARHILLVSNSCFSGGLLQTYRNASGAITNEYAHKAFATKSRHALTAGGLERVREEGGFEGLNPFGYLLNNALIENTSPYLCASSIHERIRGGTIPDSSEERPEQPLFGELAGTDHRLGGEFVFFRTGCNDLEKVLAEEKRRYEEEAKANAAAEEARKAEELKRFRLQEELDQVRKAREKLRAQQGVASGKASGPSQAAPQFSRRAEITFRPLQLGENPLAPLDSQIIPWNENDPVRLELENSELRDFLKQVTLITNPIKHLPVSICLRAPTIHPFGSKPGFVAVLFPKNYPSQSPLIHLFAEDEKSQKKIRQTWVIYSGWNERYTAAELLRRSLEGLWGQTLAISERESNQVNEHPV